MNAPLLNQSSTVRYAYLDDPEDVRKVDEWVQGHPHSTPFHLTDWLFAVSIGTGNSAYCMIAENEKADVIGMVPLHVIRSRLFGRSLVSSGFAVGGGILTDSQEIADQLADAVWQKAIKFNCPTAELRGGLLPQKNWTVTNETHANFVRPLAKDDDSELLAIPRKQRAEVRKGLEKGLIIKTGRGKRDRNWHYEVYSESVRNLGTPVFPRHLMEATLKRFRDDADILTVLADGKPVASVLSLYHKGVVMPYWGGGVHEARALRANDVMYYALMNHARARGCTAFDFGRSKVGSGAYAFKKNWGFEPQPLSYAVRTADGVEPRDINPNSPKYRAQIAIWQKLPLPIANLIGPWIAKGLG